MCSIKTRSHISSLAHFNARFLSPLHLPGSNREVSDKAYGLAGKMVNFKTYFGQRFALNLFRVCEQVAKTLQTMLSPSERCYPSKILNNPHMLMLPLYRHDFIPLSHCFLQGFQWGARDSSRARRHVPKRSLCSD